MKVWVIYQHNAHEFEGIKCVVGSEAHALEMVEGDDFLHYAEVDFVNPRKPSGLAEKRNDGVCAWCQMWKPLNDVGTHMLCDHCVKGFMENIP